MEGQQKGSFVACVSAEVVGCRWPGQLAAPLEGRGDGRTWSGGGRSRGPQTERSHVPGK